MTEDVKLDKHGFIVQNATLQKSDHIGRDNARILKWEDMLQRWDYNTKRRPTFIKKRVRKGIPDCLRGRVWAELAQIRQLKSTYGENYYKTLLETETDAISAEDIMRDIDRTFPEHILFREGNLGQPALIRTLKAYSVHDPELGYCQGMGFLIAMFLIYMSEEDAFWMLVAVMNKYQMRELYVPGMPGVYKAFYKINALFKHFMPQLWRHFRDLSLLPSMFAPSWIMTLYITLFPIEVTLRILDTFFCEGPKVIYRVYIIAFKKAKEEMLSMTLDEILERIKTIQSDFAPDELIKNAFGISLSRKKLKELDKEYETGQNSEFVNW
ncbi:unnamed protein product [Blepharisma stoltei]|uniref:Rab-GAP TBC domain-containing protein n=1 Tax=Blepharisma stoltei TaxID=1481888 RepID=A0AAU9JIQ9_9CILI|nr:unnamed protein product [Blepharisma stoltei]